MSASSGESENGRVPPEPDDDIARLAVRANLARARLFVTLRAIDERWQEVSTLPRRLRYWAGTAALAAVVLASGFIAYRTARALDGRALRRPTRLRGWRGPERGAAVDGMLRGLVRNVILALVGAVANRVLESSARGGSPAPQLPARGEPRRP